MDDTAGAQASTGPGGGPLILVVDNNNPDTLVICRRARESARYRVGTATSGEDVLGSMTRGRGLPTRVKAPIVVAEVPTIWHNWCGLRDARTTGANHAEHSGDRCSIPR